MVYVTLDITDSGRETEKERDTESKKKRMGHRERKKESVPETERGVHRR